MQCGCLFSISACDCHVPGTASGLHVCDPGSGQCVCKVSVRGQRCDVCQDGFHSLDRENSFGCVGKLNDKKVNVARRLLKNRSDIFQSNFC